MTGGAGYIGSHTVRALRDAGREVVVLDTLELGHRDAVLDAPLEVGDVADAELVGSIVARYGVDSCIHFAAYKSPAESVRDPARYFTNNTYGALRLVDALADAGVERFVFSSTCAVYGTPAQLPVSEASPLQPESPYGESKLLVERMLPWLEAAGGSRWVTLRYFNAAGASLDGRIGEDWTVTPNLIPVVMKATLRRRGPVQVFGTDFPTHDGSAIRDYIHVVDLADAHVRALEHLERGGPSATLNVGTGTGSSVLEVLAATERISGRDVPHELVDRRPGDPVAIYADTSLASRLLGWKTRFGLEEIIATAWRWHSEHLDGHSP